MTPAVNKPFRAAKSKEAVPSAPVRARIVKKHPLAIRWLHWINFPVLMAMMWSGLLILWAYDYYPLPEPVKIGGRTISLRFHVPERVSLYKWGVKPVYFDTPNAETVPRPEKERYDITIGGRLAEGMAWHFALAWLFTLNGVAYTVFLIASGEWRHLIPRKNSLIEAFKVVLHDLRLYKKPLPPGKFNHAQRIAYSVVLLMGIAMVVTGLAIYKPAQLSWLANLLGGYQAARTEHFIITALLLAFFFVHVWQVMLAGWNNFRSMITGREVVTTTVVPSEGRAH